MFNLDKNELKLLKKLNTPAKIQDYFATVPFNFEPNGDTCRSVRGVLRQGSAHCIEGALVAAAALRLAGQPPLLFDLRSCFSDQDHVVALFRRRGHWGAVSKTNHPALRYREPIFKNLRELALSYFHEYFLDSGAKTLRAYSAAPFDLRKFQSRDWLTAPGDLWDLVEQIDAAPHRELLTRSMVAALRRVDKIEVATLDLMEWEKK